MKLGSVHGMVLLAGARASGDQAVYVPWSKVPGQRYLMPTGWESMAALRRFFQDQMIHEIEKAGGDLRVVIATPAQVALWAGSTEGDGPFEEQLGADGYAFSPLDIPGPFWDEAPALLPIRKLLA
jgi:hypothetical protein